MTAAERFVLNVRRDDDGRVSAFDVEVTSPHGAGRMIHCNGTRAALVATSLHEILRRARVPAVWNSPKPVDLESKLGAQVALLLSAIAPLKRSDRVRQVSDGVAAMGREEASYWYAKSQAPRGLRALRMLLSRDERRR